MRGALSDELLVVQPGSYSKIGNSQRGREAVNTEGKGSAVLY
jgi:hypothetical protein